VTVLLFVIVSNMQTKSGKSLHPIGIGTWLIGGSYNFDPNDKYKGAKPKTDNEAQEIEAIKYSLSKGQNHIDCAELYGGFYTDELVGRALAGKNREDLYIADKLWKFSVGSGLVRSTVEAMLKKLGTDYLDLLYIHAPWDDAPWREAIPQIDALIDEGIVLGFGVSNFSVEQMQEVMQLAKHPIVANQMNYNVLYKQEIDQAFRDFCKTNSIQLVAYQPIKRKEVLGNEVIQQIAEQHNATPAQVALAWLLKKEALPIPKATQQAHIDENLQATSLALTTEDIKQLDDL
jgi:2,5-diketo-D-gluconate reductase B